MHSQANAFTLTDLHTLMPTHPCTLTHIHTLTHTLSQPHTLIHIHYSCSHFYPLVDTLMHAFTLVHTHIASLCLYCIHPLTESSHCPAHWPINVESPPWVGSGACALISRDIFPSDWREQKQGLVTALCKSTGLRGLPQAACTLHYSLSHPLTSMREGLGTCQGTHVTVGPGLRELCLRGRHWTSQAG